MPFAQNDAFKYFICEQRYQFVSLLLSSSVQFVLSDTGGGELNSRLGLECSTQKLCLSVAIIFSCLRYLLTVPPAIRELVYAGALPWHVLESLRWFLVSTLVYYTSLSELLARDR